MNKHYNHRWPLMQNNLLAEDREAIITLLRMTDRLTQGEQVEAFEQEFCKWQGCKHAVFVNSGSSANLLTMAMLKERGGHVPQPYWQMGEGGPQPARMKVVVPALTWASDISCLLHLGLEPVFVDVDRRTLGMDSEANIAVELGEPLACFVTHCMGFVAMPNLPLGNGIKHPLLIEDCCESIGATYLDGSKVGTKGLAANFSFYYAHHMTTIEGGMVTTDDDNFAILLRSMRDHGLRQEQRSDFVFDHRGFNFRNTEIAATIGRSQLKRLDQNIEARRDNMDAFLAALDGKKYQTDFATSGYSPYGLVLVQRAADVERRDKVEHVLREHQVEFRRGIAGGGNQLRQPYLVRLYGTDRAKRFPVAEHLTDFGWVIGNWPGLPREWIAWLCEELNKL